MGLPRFILSIVVSLGLAIVGALLVYSGGTALIRSAVLYSLLEETVGNTGTTVREALNLNGQFALSFTDAIVPAMFTVGALFVGGTLLFLGLRGLVRRIVAGLPTEDEGDPKTETGRMGQMLLYGAGTAFGLWGLALGSLDTLSYLVLSTSGVQTTAEVEGIRTQNRTRDGRMPGVYFDYSFRSISGEVVTGTQLVPSSNFSRAYSDGGELTIYYSLGSPQTHAFPDLRAWSGIAQFMAFRLILVVFGVWGLRRNLRIGGIDRPGDAMAAARP